MLLFALTTVAQPVYYNSVCVPVSQSALPEAPPPAPTPLKHWNLFVCRRLFFALTSGGGGPGTEKLTAKEAEVPQSGEAIALSGICGVSPPRWRSAPRSQWLSAWTTGEKSPRTNSRCMG